MATCQIYADETAPYTPDQEITFLALETQIRLAGEAGLTAQEKEAKDELVIRRFGLTPLNTEEFTKWRAWFPMSYRADYFHCGNCGMPALKPSPYVPDLAQLANYRFDRVPVSVLELIRSMKDKLDWIEIRTPEQAHMQDPGIFGGIGKFAALFGRWGESDARLISFEEITSGLKARRRVVSNNGIIAIGEATVFLGAAVGSMLAFGEPRDSTRYELFQTLARYCWWFGSVGIPIATIGFWRHSKIRRAFRYAFQ